MDPPTRGQPPYKGHWLRHQLRNYYSAYNSDLNLPPEDSLQIKDKSVLYSEACDSLSELLACPACTHRNAQVNMYMLMGAQSGQCKQITWRLHRALRCHNEMLHASVGMIKEPVHEASNNRKLCDVYMVFG